VTGGWPPTVLKPTGTAEDARAHLLRWAMIEKLLGVSDHFAGRSLTAADIIRLFPLTNMRELMACDPAASAGRRQGLLAVGRPLSRGRL